MHTIHHHKTSFPEFIFPFFEPSVFESERKPSIPVNIIERRDSLEVEIPVPGFSKEAINLQVEGNRTLKIEGKAEPATDNSHGVIRQKRFSIDSFTKKFRLGNDLNPEKITATVENGLLRITIAKSAAGQKENVRQIPLA
jgi:HSP20 family protein